MVRFLNAAQLGLPLVAVLTLAGCCTPMIASHRFNSHSGGDPGIEPCACQNVLEHASLCARRPHGLLPGSDPDSKGMFPAGSTMVQPPHSKFHPVPTRPVFESRDPSNPVGLHELNSELVPTPAAESSPVS